MDERKVVKESEHETDLLKILEKREQDKLDKVKQRVLISELIVIYNKPPKDQENEDVEDVSHGEFYSDEKKSIKSIVDRLTDYINELATLANDYHESKYFSKGKEGLELEEAHLNTITRLSLNEFALFPRDKPLSLAEFKDLLERIELLTETKQKNLHLSLGTLPVLVGGKVLNCNIYVECGSSVKIHTLAKSYSYEKMDEFGLPSDPEYKDSQNFSVTKLPAKGGIGIKPVSAALDSTVIMPNSKYFSIVESIFLSKIKKHRQ